MPNENIELKGPIVASNLEADVEASEGRPFLAYENDQDEDTRKLSLPQLNKVSKLAVWLPKRVRFLLIGILIVCSGLYLFSKHKYQTLPPRTWPGTAWLGFNEINNMFVFGDSWSVLTFVDTNVVAVAPTHPLDYPSWDNNRDLKYFHYLTYKYNHSVIQTWNFAIGGAVVDYDYAKTYSAAHTFINEAEVLFMNDWVAKERETSHHEGYEPERTLFTMFFGIGDLYHGNPLLDKIDHVFASYEAIIEKLYHQASAKNFLVFHCIPLESAPMYSYYAPRLGEDMPKSVAAFNEGVSRMAARLQARYADITVFEFDLHSWMDKVLEDPKSTPQTAMYTNLTLPCLDMMQMLAGNLPSEQERARCEGSEGLKHLWADALHVTPPLHEGMAVAIEQILLGNATKHN